MELMATSKSDGMVAGRKPTCDETEQCDGMVAGRKPPCDETEQSSHYLHERLKMKGLSETFVYVAAIDFGTTYSGYAFSSRQDYLTDPLKNLQQQYMLQDETGKELPAVDVFSATIGYLKNDAIAKLRTEYPSLNENSDIRWVLTVPAYWTDACKQFMREAANKAGIINENLLIALEPEAASLCCCNLSVQWSTYRSFLPGSKYMVIDAGGGTVDITVHEIEEIGKMRELYAANIDNCSDMCVVQAFRNFLASIVGNDIMDEFQNSPGEYIELFQTFEIQKRNFMKTNNKNILLRVPVILSTLFKEKRKQYLRDFVAAKFQRQGIIRWTMDKLLIDASTANGFFNDAFQTILKHLDALFLSGNVDDVPTILMVGGLFESPMLQEIMQNRFKDKRILIPTDPAIAVLKGAVFFGHERTLIEDR